MVYNKWTVTNMERKDAPNARSGISKELLRDIDAQRAILDSAVKLISQRHQASERKTELDSGFGEWVYSMEGLQNWVHHYTKRKKLSCPHCKSEQTFSCSNCNNEFEYHDQL
jgi:hypothetical protein